MTAHVFMQFLTFLILYTRYHSLGQVKRSSSSADDCMRCLANGIKTVCF